MSFSNRRSRWSRLAFGLLLGGLIMFSPPALPAMQDGGTATSPQQDDPRLHNLVDIASEGGTFCSESAK